MTPDQTSGTRAYGQSDIVDRLLRTAEIDPLGYPDLMHAAAEAIVNLRASRADVARERDRALDRVEALREVGNDLASCHDDDTRLCGAVLAWQELNASDGGPR